MDTRLGTARSPWQPLLATVVALALVMTLGATSATAASPTSCRVQNTDTGKAYHTLQPSVDAAGKGDRLTVEGTCRGGTLIDKRLVIEGLETPTSERPTLSGAKSVRVMRIAKGVKLKVVRVVITGGRAKFAAGVLNSGTLVLTDVLVRGNATDGSRKRFGVKAGGVWNRGSLTLNGSSRISGNASFTGGGVVNSGTLTLNDTSAIRRNTADGGVWMQNGGGGVFNYGTLTLNDTSSINENHARTWGGGVDNGGYSSTLTLNGASAIRGNTGGGVHNVGSVTLADSSRISGNKGNGVANAGTLTLTDNSSISDNDAGPYEGGGGVWFWNLNDRPSCLTMNDSSTISGNSAKEGGGLHYSPQIHVLIGVRCGPQADANVFSNTPDDCYLR